MVGKIQSICNGKCDANYNARPCAGERKAARQETMASNGKNNAQNNRKQSEIRASADVRSRRAGHAMALRAESLPGGSMCSRDLRMSLGAKRRD
jgi:hypothetical protein